MKTSRHILAFHSHVYAFWPNLVRCCSCECICTRRKQISMKWNATVVHYTPITGNHQDNCVCIYIYIICIRVYMLWTEAAATTTCIGIEPGRCIAEFEFISTRQSSVHHVEQRQVLERSGLTRPSTCGLDSSCCLMDIGRLRRSHTNWTVDRSLCRQDTMTSK